MRYLYAILFLLTLINFSGLPELLSAVMGESRTYCSLIEEESGNEDQQEKGKEDNKEEKEDVKESLLAHHYLLHVSGTGENILAHNRRLLECSYVAKDHSPPPERG
jgi:hypothetical protein